MTSRGMTSALRVGLSRARQIDMKRAASSDLALDCHPPTMIAHDAIHDSQAKTRPFALFLLREEGLEEMGHVLFRDAVPFVVHGDDHEASLDRIRSRRWRCVPLLHDDANESAMIHRLKCVDQQVRENLQKLLRIGVHFPHRPLTLDQHLRPRIARQRRQRSLRRLGQFDHIHHATLGAAPSKIEHTAHRLGHAMGLLQHRPRTLVNIGRDTRVLLDDACVSGDHIERRTELMRELRGELPNGAKTVCVTQLFEGLRALHIALFQGTARIVQLPRHVVHLACELRDLALPFDHLARSKITACDALGQVAQTLDRLAHQPTRERERDDARQHRERERLQRERPPTDATQKCRHGLRFGELDRDDLMPTLDGDVRDDLVLVHTDYDLALHQARGHIGKARPVHAFDLRRNETGDDVRAGNLFAVEHRLGFTQRVVRPVVAREGRLQRMPKEASITKRGLKEQSLLFFHAHDDAHTQDKRDGGEEREPESNRDPHDVTVYSKPTSKNARTRITTRTPHPGRRHRIG